jgi:hypothetical protein
MAAITTSLEYGLCIQPSGHAFSARLRVPTSLWVVANMTAPVETRWRSQLRCRLCFLPTDIHYCQSRRSLGRLRVRGEHAKESLGPALIGRLFIR